MKTPHILVVVVLLYWILLLDTSPDRHGFNEWAGNFGTKQRCEQALKYEQMRSYDMNPDQVDPDKPDIHRHGKDAVWVHGLPGVCEPSDELSHQDTTKNYTSAARRLGAVRL